MAKEENLLHKMLVANSDRMERCLDALEKRLGHFGEDVSPERQMAAYENMSPQEFAQLTDIKGPEEMEKFIRSMEWRRKLRDANTNPA